MSDLRVADLLADVAALRQERDELQSKLDSMAVYSHETVRGAVQWRDDRIAELEAALRGMVRLVDSDLTERVADSMDTDRPLIAITLRELAAAARAAAALVTAGDAGIGMEEQE